MTASGNFNSNSPYYAPSSLSNDFNKLKNELDMLDDKFGDMFENLYWSDHSKQMRYWNDLSTKILNINNLLKNNSDNEYNKNDFEEITFLANMVYDEKNNKIELEKNETEDNTDIFKEKLGSICDATNNIKINIFLSISGYIVYEWDNNYSLDLIFTKNFNKNIFQTIRDKISINRNDNHMPEDHIMPKIYKLHLINTIKINPELSISESIEYLKQFQVDINILYNQLTYSISISSLL
jgi:hypothetical protein